MSNTTQELSALKRIADSDSRKNPALTIVDGAKGGQDAAIVAILRARYPNLKLVYVSSRTYGGYATTPLNPEPYAYDSGFAVKWLVTDRIAGRVKGPWVGWGPYLWTDGEKGRKDGLFWTCADVRPTDGTHPSDSGR